MDGFVSLREPVSEEKKEQIMAEIVEAVDYRHPPISSERQSSDPLGLGGGFGAFAETERHNAMLDNEVGKCVCAGRLRVSLML